MKKAPSRLAWNKGTRRVKVHGGYDFIQGSRWFGTAALLASFGLIGIMKLTGGILDLRNTPIAEAKEYEKPVIVISGQENYTEKQKIMAYMIEKFGDDAANAIAMVRICENSTLDPRRVSPLNIQKSGRRSYDVGVMQINVDENDIEEQERLKDYKYNIDRGYAKYKARGNKFTDWTCATVIGQKNYLGK